MTKEEVKKTAGKPDAIEDCKFNDRKICHQWKYNTTSCSLETVRDPGVQRTGQVSGDCTVRFSDDTELVDQWDENRSAYTMQELR